ncbi:MAG: hypothetical protein LBQ62_05300 [Candidatus Accumulibacter sp.]|jgi:hypothetical protein|nr:hypothetical protein [Accumulibacter sp.]
MNGYTAFGLLLAAAGGACVYLASPNQCWRAAPWPAAVNKAARAGGALLLIAGLAALRHVLQAPAACFVFAHWLMLLFVLFPYLGALLCARRNAS